MVTNNNAAQVEPSSPFDRRLAWQNKRSEIIRVAGEIFCTTGFSHTSLEDIAKRLGLSKTIFYYYFKSKKELFVACHLVATELLEAAFVSAANPDPFLHLRGFVRLYVISLIGSSSPGSVLLDVHLLPERESGEIRSRREAVHQKLESLLRRLVRAGRIRKVDRRLAVVTIMSAVNVIPRWYRADGRWSAEQVAEHCVAMLVDGLLLEGGLRPAEQNPTG